jgi:hypothetical protein
MSEALRPLPAAFLARRPIRRHPDAWRKPVNDNDPPDPPPAASARAGRLAMLAAALQAAVVAGVFVLHGLGPPAVV